jgi:phosphoadenosine phosphosulfate reductase
MTNLTALAVANLQQAQGSGKAVFTSSFGLEDMVIGELIAQHQFNIEIATLDTGRLYPETYELIEAARLRWRRPIRVLSPQAAQLEHFVSVYGINGFRESKTVRAHCCEIRKLEPLERALQDAKAWVTGLRRSQSEQRTSLAAVQADAPRGLVKFSPLLEWSETDVWQFIRANKIPYNPLHDAGFPSIGCAPCTRAVLPGEHPRSGRWWWESDQTRECGLHLNASSLAPS